jgi:DNA-directed RNA polymerase subunit M/transcription elongation factor TFIIS
MDRIACPNCGHRLKVLDEHIGKRGRCQKCRHAFLLPKPSSVTMPPKHDRQTDNVTVGASLLRSSKGCCPKCGQRRKLWETDLFSGLCKKCRADAVAERKACRMQEMRACQQMEQARLIAFWTPEKAALKGADKVKRSLVDAGMNDKSAQRIVDGFFPDHVRPTEKSMTVVEKVELDRCRHEYFVSCIALGGFLLVGLLANIFFLVYQNRHYSAGHKMEMKGFVIFIFIYIIWAVVGFAVMIGTRWIIWAVLILATIRLVVESAFILGGANNPDGWAIYHLVLFGGATFLSVWCIHSMQLVNRARNPK